MTATGCSCRQLRAGLPPEHVFRVPLRPSLIAPAEPPLELAMRRLGTAQRSAAASSAAEAKVVSPSTRPGSRVVIS